MVDVEVPPIDIVLPPRSSPLLEPTGYEILWYSPPVGLRRVFVPKAAEVCRVPGSLPPPVGYLIRPLYADPSLVGVPAGALASHPVATDAAGRPARLEARWRHGPVVWVLLQISRALPETRHLNLTRLEREILRRGGADPWRLDLNDIVLAVRDGEIGLSRIELQEEYQVRLPDMGLPIVAANPLFRPGSVSPNDAVLLTPGLHQFVSEHMRVDVHVGTEGRVAVLVAARPPGTARTAEPAPPRP